MNLLRQIVEMTMRAGDLDHLGAEYANQHAKEWFNHPHIGDIEQFTIRLKDGNYSLWHGKNLAGHIDTLSKGDGVYVEIVWIAPEHRGKRLFSKVLWFLKTREGFDKIVLGNIHSTDMQEVVKGLSRFAKSWQRGDEVKPFSVGTLDDFYSSAAPTGWQLVLENDGNFTDWPRFTGGRDYIRESYDWQIE